MKTTEWSKLKERILSQVGESVVPPSFLHGPEDEEALSEYAEDEHDPEWGANPEAASGTVIVRSAYYKDWEEFRQLCDPKEYEYEVKVNLRIPFDLFPPMQEILDLTDHTHHCSTHYGDENLNKYNIVLKNEKVIALFSTDDNGDLWVAGSNLEDCYEYIKPYRKFQKPPSPKKTQIPISFYFNTASGPSISHRDIDTLDWADIDVNYPQKTRKDLDSLINYQPVTSADGGVVLLHSPPGTGKTSFIRCLMHRWLPWATPYYITDPEAFFGSAQYMMSVIANNDGSTNAFRYKPDSYEQPEWWEQGKVISRTNDRWRFLIVEDASRFISADYGDGQSVARLLNLADGILGQGTRFIIAITTNQRVAEINPAINRPGRCLADIQFETFSPTDANKWLAQNNSQIVVNQEKSLAELYELITENKLAAVEETEPGGVYL